MLANYPKYVLTRVLQRLGLSDVALQVGNSSQAIIPNPPRVMKSFTDRTAQAEFLADPSLRTVLEKSREAKTFWDVGANMGLFSVLARDVNPGLEVVSIEASTDFYQVLCRNWQLNPRGWTCLHFAVGDHEGLVQMSRGGGGCDHVLTASELRGPDARETRPMATLDRLVQMMGHDRIDLLKIDVEGLELAVLRGASGLLDAGKIGTIVLEADEHDLRYGSNNSELVAFLASKDYHLDVEASIYGRSANNCQVFAMDSCQEAAGQGTMKILVATAHRTIVGGIEMYLQTLIPALLQRAHQVATLTEHRPDAAFASIDPLEADLPAWYCEDLHRDPELWADIARWRPDVVYSHGLPSLDIDQRLQDEYPAVTYLHGYVGTCATGRKCHAFPMIRPCTRSFGPACLLLHYPRRCGGLSPIQALRTYKSERARHERLPEYAGILVASSHMYSEFRRNGVSADRLHLLRLPVAEVPRSTPPAPKTPAGNLLFLGRLTDLKGADFLIRAMPLAEKKLGSKISLSMAGDGGELENLKSLSRKLGAEVTFTGWVSGQQKVDLMRRADLLVVPSLWPEPFGLVGVEAGCVGLPAAGFAAGGIPDWLIPGRTGELAPADPPTVEGLADAIVRALADPGHYNALCRGAFELSQLFTVDAHMAELEGILSAHAKRSGASEGAPWLACNHGHQ